MALSRKRRASSSFVARKKAKYATRTTGGKGRRKYAKSRFAKAVKSVILKTAETKYRTKALTYTAPGIGIGNHNLLVPITLWSTATNDLWPDQGVTDLHRNGDEIYATGIMLRGVFRIPPDRFDTTIKMWYVPFNSKQGNPSDKTQFFHSAINNTMVDAIQTDRWKGIRYLGALRCRATDQSGSQAKTIMFKRWIPMKRKITFNQDSTQLPANIKEEGTIIIAAYDTILTLESDDVFTNFEGSATLYFKDP